MEYVISHTGYLSPARARTSTATKESEKSSPTRVTEHPGMCQDVFQQVQFPSDSDTDEMVDSKRPNLRMRPVPCVFRTDQVIDATSALPTTLQHNEAFIDVKCFVDEKDKYFAYANPTFKQFIAEKQPDFTKAKFDAKTRMATELLNNSVFKFSKLNSGTWVEMEGKEAFQVLYDALSFVNPPKRVQVAEIVNCFIALGAKTIDIQSNFGDGVAKSAASEVQGQLPNGVSAGAGAQVSLEEASTNEFNCKVECPQGKQQLRNLDTFNCQQKFPSFPSIVEGLNGRVLGHVTKYEVTLKMSVDQASEMQVKSSLVHFFSCDCFRNNAVSKTECITLTVEYHPWVQVPKED